MLKRDGVRSADPNSAHAPAGVHALISLQQGKMSETRLFQF